MSREYLTGTAVIAVEPAQVESVASSEKVEGIIFILISICNFLHVQMLQSTFLLKRVFL